MNIFSRILTISLILCLSSCSTGKKALQKGNYYDAVIKAVERLRSNPDSKNANQTLKTAYPMAVETLKAEVQELLGSNEAFKYAEVVARYMSLNSMAEEIRRSPAALQIIPMPQTFTSQLKAAKDQAAPEAYNAAERLLKQNTRESAKEAYFLFLDADDYIPGYRDVQEKINEARFIATLKVLVEEIPVPGRYKLNSDFFYNQMQEYLHHQVPSNFVSFLNAEEAQKLPFIDQLLVMEFYDFQVGSTKDSESTKQVLSQDSVKVGSATVNGQNVDVYDKVKANLTLSKRQVSSSGQLKVSIIDANTNKTLASKIFPGSFVWTTEWASYNGDERALTAEEKEKCKQKPALPPPPQDLFYEFTRPIFNQVKSFLTSYYRNY